MDDVAGWYDARTPLEWVECLGRAIRLSLTDGSAIDGWLYTIDPQHHHVVIVVVDSGKPKPKSVVVLGHSISKLECKFFGVLALRANPLRSTVASDANPCPVNLSSDDFATICSPLLSVAPEEQQKRRDAVKQMLEKVGFLPPPTSKLTLALERHSAQR